jgi:hypothetical protein
MCNFVFFKLRIEKKFLNRFINCTTNCISWLDIRPGNSRDKKPEEQLHEISEGASGQSPR